MADQERKVDGGVAQLVVDDDLPWSGETLALVRKIQEAKTKEERGNLMLALAGRVAAENDPTDETATDDYHGVVEEFEKARLRYQQTALRLARLTVDLVQQYAASKDSTVEDVTTAVQQQTNRVLN